MFDRIQKIGTINGSNNLIINGDVIANEEILTTVATQLLRSDLERLSQEARAEMEMCVNECTQKVAEQVVEKKLEEKLTEFVRPATQLAFYSTLRGYTRSETQEQREMMVDSIIDWIQNNWNTTERMIIDTALEILPKLTPATLSTIGLLQLRHQLITGPIGMMVDHFFSRLTPLVEQMAGIGILETEYLKQEKLILPLPAMRSVIPFVEYMKQTYDLFFRKSLPDGVYESYCLEHPEAGEAIMDKPIRSCMMWKNGVGNSEWGFCISNSNMLRQMLMERHQEYIIPHVEALMDMMTPFTEQEVKAYFLKFTPVWEKVITLFSSEVFTKYKLSIVGNYIGGKVLAKVNHGTPLPLTEYNKQIL